MVFLMILLFSYFQISQQIQKTMVNGKEMLSNPRLKPVQGTLNVVMNQNVTLSCNSDSGSPPVRYTLFKRNQKVSTLNRPDLTPSLFNLTISSASDLGEYKCKAENNNTSGGKYSNSLNFTLLEPISKPVLSSPTSQAKKGQNVTLSCLSENGSLPITYIFFKGTQSISSQVMIQKEAAEIVLFINSSSDFGTYKCRAENGFRRNAKYSNGFNFTLAEERRLSQPLIISLGLILLLFAIGLALAILFFIIPSYKAKKFKCTRPSTGFTSTPNAEEPEDEVIYSEIVPVKPEEEYINFSVIRREDEKVPGWDKYHQACTERDGVEILVSWLPSYQHPEVITSEDFNLREQAENKQIKTGINKELNNNPITQTVAYCPNSTINPNQHNAITVR